MQTSTNTVTTSTSKLLYENHRNTRIESLKSLVETYLSSLNHRYSKNFVQKQQQESVSSCETKRSSVVVQKSATTTENETSDT